MPPSAAAAQGERRDLGGGEELLATQVRSSLGTPLCVSLGGTGRAPALAEARAAESPKASRAPLRLSSMRRVHSITPHHCSAPKNRQEHCAFCFDTLLCHYRREAFPEPAFAEASW